MSAQWSHIGVAHSAGRSRLVSSLSIPPLKLVNPRALSDRYAAVIMSGYGGGMVEGDSVRLRIDCGAGAGLYLGTQAFTRIYKCPNGQTTEQEIEGVVGVDSCAVVLPDLVVPYANSRFAQRQSWQLQEGALLVLADGHTAGRLQDGERFSYDSYASSIEITTHSRPLLVDRYCSEPAVAPPARTGAMGTAAAVLNVFVAGWPGESRFEEFCAYLRAQLEPEIERQFRVRREHGELVLALTQKDGVLVLRATARRHEDLKRTYEVLGNAMALPQILGTNPLARKY